jgi:hypothetical protein
MIFSFHVGLTDSVMQFLFSVSKKLNDLLSMKNNLNFRQRNSQNCQNNFITIKNFY